LSGVGVESGCDWAARKEARKKTRSALEIKRPVHRYNMKHFLKFRKGDWAETRVSPRFERHHYNALLRHSVAKREQLDGRK
jgi:hypothetical protein